MKTTTKALIALTVIGLTLGACKPAFASDGTSSFEDFAVPNPTRPQTERVLLTIDTSEHNGETCSIVVDTVNGESVHPENFITVEGGIPPVTVTGTEDAASGVHQSTFRVVLGDTLDVINHFQLATSVDGDIVIDCTPVTTTTQATTTTTQATTTTTVPEATTTTRATTTTSSGPTTTVPEVTTTAPGVSTTLIVTTTVPPVTGSTLPFTGPEDYAPLAVAGGALILLGWAVKVTSRA